MRRDGAACGGRVRIALLLSVVAVLLGAWPSEAVRRITLTGPAPGGPVEPDAQGRFVFPDVPLRKNAVNVFTVTATDEAGRTLSREVRITQLSLDAIVVSKVTATPLTVQQIEQLVSDGIIKLDDPQNFNVSQFDIVLTIAKQSVPISVPVAMPITGLGTGFETIRLPSDIGPSSGGRIDPVEIVVFALPVLPSGSDLPAPPPIPGVIIIEGRIKTLKEFFSVRLLLMNTSGIFTLRDVKAKLAFPTGGLSPTLPSDGIASFGDILPGTGDQPSQAEREFIVRGDEIGVRPVRVDFGGSVGGPGIPDDGAIPFNGSATATVEVKGPPTFQVQVKHPPGVVQGVPYDLTVDITNAGETPALYASLGLDVGGDGRLVDCRLDGAAELPVCEPIDGPSTRSLGNIFPGQRVSETFTVLPLTSGTISSCLGIAAQNISLQVFVGAINCLVGSVPPATASPDGVPSVTVLPAANTLGVSIDSPVTALFSEPMNVGTITTGPTGSFRVIDDRGQDVPGRLRFETINDKAVAIWQVDDGITNRLTENAEFTVFLSQEIRDLQGNALAGAWRSRFTTTSPTDDDTPPSLTLSVEPPVNPSLVLPGQIVRINAYAADQGTGVTRVELRRQDTSTPGAPFEMVDQKTVFDGSSGPCIFSVDSAQLVTGHTYQFKATAYDRAGNSQDATIAVIVAPSASPPVIRLADPGEPLPQGIALALRLAEISAGVKTIDYFLDAGAVAVRTVTLPPFQTSLDTVALAPGPHQVRAVAVDGLGQTGQAILDFTVAVNGRRPIVDFGSSVNGAQHVVDSAFTVAARATDPVGIQSVLFFLDSLGGAPIASGLAPFIVSTRGLPLGPHRIIAVATNKLGVTNDPSAPGSSLAFSVVTPGSGSPPDAPLLDPFGAPLNGVVTVSGTTEPGARVDIRNLTSGLGLSVVADGTGRFSALIPADPGDQVRVTTVNLASSPQPSAPTTATVPAPPVLDRIEVAPAAFTLTAVNAFADLTVTAVYTDSTSANVTSQATYASSNLAVASLNAAGRVVALSNGEAIITAQFGGKQAQATVTVSIRTLVGIALDPAAVSLAGIGKTRQLAVIGTYSDSTTSPVTSGVAFSTSAPAVALVGAGGLVTSTGLGGAVIGAAVSGLPPAQAQVSVLPVVPVSISASPNSILFTQAGESRQLLISRTLSDGGVEPAPAPIAFQTSDLAVVTVDAGGLVTAVADGDATITVTHLGFETTVAVTVDIPVVLAPPEITALDRPRAAEGDLFTIRGRHFAALPAQNHVTVNGVPADVQSARQDELAAVVPAGAATGPVTVSVGAFTSNPATLTIYPRRARSLELTAPVDLPAAAGQTLVRMLGGIDFRAGDVAILSSAPDAPAPLDFDGTLRVKVDEGAFGTVPPSTTDVVDMSSLFTPGAHSLTIELAESGGRIRTGAIHLLVGPDDTGPIAGERFVVALGQSRPIPVTITEIPLPDGATVAVTVAATGFVLTPGGACCVASAGGSIVNGQATADNRFRAFTVGGGRIDVVYDPAGAAGLGTGTAVANVQVLPADASGNRTSSASLVVEPVTLTTFDTAAAPRSQSGVIADGAPKLVTVTLAGIRDTGGNLIPDSSTVAVTAAATGFVLTPEGACCVASAGGTIVNGQATADPRFRAFTVTGGRVEIQFDPGAVLLPVGDVRSANVQILAAEPDGDRIGSRAFAVVPITLSSPSAEPASISVAPTSALADGADNRVTVTVAGITDALGNPVPDGTTLAVTAAATGFVLNPAGGCCVASAGGTIVNGQPTADSRFRAFTTQGGRVQIIYSGQGAALLAARQSATARVQLLPAQPTGTLIGTRAFAVADITLTGYQTAEAAAVPSSAVADGFSKIVAVTLTGIRDTAGNLVPDGSTVAVTATATGFVLTPEGACCVASAGGTIANGDATADSRFRAFTVTGGRIDVQYDPGSLLLPVGDVRTANVQALPAETDGDRIGSRAFAVVPVTVSSPTVPAANVSVAPGSALADGNDNRVTVTVTGITDALGNPVPDGTTLAVTAVGTGFVLTPGGACCVASAGGTIVNGAATGDSRFRAFTTVGGQVQITYSAAGATPLAARQSGTARVQLLPAQPSGAIIGTRALAVGAVTLTGYQDAGIGGAGTLAKNSIGVYPVTEIRDTAGALVPDGSKVLVAVQTTGFVTSPDGSCCVSSAGGTIVNGEATADILFRAFTVVGGAISVEFQAPAAAGGTAVLQLLPAEADGDRIGNRSFAIKAIAITP